MGRDPSAAERLAHNSNKDFEVGEIIWKDSLPSSFSTGETTHIFSRSCTFQEPQSTTSPFSQGRGRNERREVENDAWESHTANTHHHPPETPTL